MKKVPTTFSCTITSELQETSAPSLFSCNVRVFYTGLNRNGSFITPSVAQQLMDSGNGKPVIGFYNHETGDFEGHVYDKELCRAYGFIQPNSWRWEKHIDDDGVEREYAVCSVTLWCEYWSEAAKVIGKGQSMELNLSNSTGSWEEVGGEECYVYKTAKLKGLCVVGADRTPCFQGAQFFEKNEEYTKFLSAIKEVYHLVEHEVIKGEVGLEVMDTDTPTGTSADSDTATPVAHEGVTAPAAEEVVVEEDTGFADTEGVTTPAPQADPTPAADYEALLSERDTLKEQVAAFKTQITDFEAQVAELTTSLAALQEVKQAYDEMCNNALRAQKNELLSKFAALLTEEKVKEIVPSADDLSIEDINTKLSVAYAEAQFSLKEAATTVIPTIQFNSQSTQLTAILEKYRRNA